MDEVFIIVMFLVSPDTDSTFIIRDFLCTQTGKCLYIFAHGFTALKID